LPPPYVKPTFTFPIATHRSSGILILLCWTQEGISANVGYEIGVPAYPDPTHAGTHQLPLATANLAAIISQTQPQYKGGFFWEMFKAQVQLAC